MFLVQMVTRLGDGLGFLKNVNPVELFDAYGLAAASGEAVVQAAMLAAAGAALFVAGAVAFCRRDFNV